MNDPQMVAGTLRRPALRAWFLLGPVVVLALIVYSALRGGDVMMLLSPFLGLFILLVGLQLISGMLPGGNLIYGIAQRVAHRVTATAVGTVRGATHTTGRGLGRGSPVVAPMISFRLAVSTTGQVLECLIGADGRYHRLGQGDQVTLTGRRHRDGRVHVRRLQNRSNATVVRSETARWLRAEYAARVAWVIFVIVLIDQLA